MGFLIIALVLVGVGFALSGKYCSKFKFIGIAAGVLFLIISCIRFVPTGHTGVATIFGAVQPYTYEAGIHFCNPLVNVTNMDNRTQKSQIELSCFSSDIQEVSVVYTVNYQINKQNAQNIYRNIGTDYYNVVVQPKVLEAVKGVTAKYNAESLVEKRGTLSKEIEETLKSEMGNYNIEIVATSIENIDFTDTFTNAVEAKQVAEQNKLKAKTEQEQLIIESNAAAEKRKIEAQAEADSQVIAAKADAEVAKIGADAAEYQGQKDAAIMGNLGKMLSDYPNLLQYYYTTYWDGQLPETYMNSEGTSTLFEIPVQNGNSSGAATVNPVPAAVTSDDTGVTEYTE